MRNYIKKLQNELENCGCMPLFEIEVKDKSGNQDWVSCDISFHKDSIQAERIAVSSKEQRSKFIATSRVPCSPDWTLDEHLQELMEEIQADIIDGDLFDLV